MKTEDFKPRAMRAPLAASYCGMGRSKFLQMVKDGLAPKPKRPSIGVTIWDRVDLDKWFDNMGATQ